ncbi:MAG TPA: hypothetical protein VGL42_14730 [Opitutaceae bacterium]|jgi:hypothetical protein
MSGDSQGLCGACLGTSVQTPQPEYNPPGQPAVARRVGTWGQFYESMLARLSSSDYPALQKLTTRSNDDFTIAFLDATSVMLDILTFYQERLGNEFYLRTAQQTRSLTELSRLIGYQPSPGVSATAYVAFTLTNAPGQPANPNAPAVTIPKGTQVQSVAAQGQAPQTFETSADIQAKADWTKLAVQTGLSWAPQYGDQSVYLAGTATQLNPGDLFVVVGDERIGNSGDNHWDVRMVTSVQTDTVNDRTLVSWSEGLGHQSGSSTQDPASIDPQFQAFRQRAALFGYSAMDPNLLNTKHLPNAGNILSTDGSQWLNFQLGSTIDLDSVYSKVTTGSWVALLRPDSTSQRIPPGDVSLYQATAAVPVAKSAFGLSAKITSVVPDDNSNLSSYPLRTTLALVQSEALPAAEQPLTYPQYGSSVSLEVLRNDVANVQVIALSGKRQKIALAAEPSAVGDFVPDDSTVLQRALGIGEILTLTTATNLPVDPNGNCLDWSGATAEVTLYVQDASGRTGSILAAPAAFALSPASPGDPTVSEYALVTGVDSSSSDHTTFLLSGALNFCYDRSATSVNANVAQVTGGQSVTEILGNGSATAANQEFTLRQSPLTFVQAPTVTGWASTLVVRANGKQWSEVPTLYHASPTASVFETSNQSDGTTDVLGGDGIEGATLPTGQNNIQATYRIGSGSAQNVPVGAISILIDRPLGVSGVTNPGPASGGQDPQSLSGIRQNAPQTVLTLGRAVSIADYQNFASTYSGVAKAYAVWIPSGTRQGVFITLAGTNGAAVPAGSATNGDLGTALKSYGNPLIPINVQTYIETLFTITANVQYDPGYQQPVVEAQIRSTLASTFNFASRAFGQGVSYDEVSTVIQNVPGVIAVNVVSLGRGDSSSGGDIGQAGAPTVSQWNLWLGGIVNPPLVRPYNDPANGLCCYLPVPSPGAVPWPAEVLVLDPRPSGVVLGLMT